MKKEFLIFVMLLVVSCSKPPSPPGEMNLVYPSKNLECTEGVNSNDSTSAINFQWATATHTDQYQISIADLETGIRYSRTTSATSIEINLNKRRAYSWKVTASNNEVIETSVSEEWYFYVSGSVLTQVPYQAYPIQPVPGSFVDANENNQVYLQWLAADSDNDISAFEVYLDTVNPPVAQLDFGGQFTANVYVDVTPNTYYYWRIKTIDQQGNYSISPVFDFKVN